MDKGAKKMENLTLNNFELNSLCQLLKIERVVEVQEKLEGEKKSKLEKINLQQIYEKFEFLNENLRKMKKLRRKKPNNENNIVSFGDNQNKIIFTFFINGVKIRDYPFMEYKNEQTMKLFLDILEGFYPEIL